MKVLVVDDDAGLRKSLGLILKDAGYEVRTAQNAEAGLDMAKGERPDMILVDVRMPGMDGLGFVETYKKEGGEAPVLVMTAYGGLDLAVEAMKRGAYDYLPKPFGGEEVLLALRKVEEREQLRREVGRLRSEVRTERQYGEIVARSGSMVQALEMAQKVARHSTSVLITGATGTGKELLARLIHTESDRADGPFVPVNCGAVPGTLLESEFFGHVRGAFTGADRDKDGLFEAAHGGTLFLDEVGELPDTLQVKLLRALQEGEIRRVGATDSRSVDVRIVAATNRSMDEEVAFGRFRQDLYYRLAVVTLAIPALTERPDDLIHLVRHFLRLHGERLGVEVEGLDREAMDALHAYSWPGNVRELENVLERALVLTEGPRIHLGDLPPRLRGEGGPNSEAVVGSDYLAGAGGASSPAAGGAGADRDPGASPSGEEDLSVKRRGALLEKDLIRKALRRTGGHRGKAARLLELSDRALRYKIKEYGIDPEV
jgi:two-component system, NtrC family, response regulator AtoC